MATPQSVQVIDRDGRRGTIDGTFDREDGAPVLVRFENGERVLVPRDLLSEEPSQGGEQAPYRLRASLDALLKEQSLLESQEAETQSGDVRVIPVIEERAQVRRETVTGTVRLHKKVQERVELIDEPLVSEEVIVERVPLNRPVDEAPAVRREGDTLVIPLLEEVLVVEKRLLLREEVRIRKLRKEVRSPQEVSLRSEKLEVTRQPGPSADEQSH